MAYGRASNSRYPQCDSYFVEDELEDRLYSCKDFKEDPVAAGRCQEEKRLELTMLTREYYNDILAHMEYMEVATMPDVASIELQTEIQWYMRPYLLDFLIEAHLAFSLLPETLFLTVNILDRYCSKRVVYKRHYQLVGCTALLIAAKYGDKKDKVPTLRELKGMCCSLYDEDMFVQMEWHVLETLKWTIGHPSVDAFLQMILPCVSYNGDDQKSENLAKYILEIALFHKEFLSVRPSIMARTSLALARHVLGVPDHHVTEWSKEIDTNVLLHLSVHLHQPSQVLYRKYSSPQFDGVAVTLEHFMARQAAIANQQYQSGPPTPPSLAYDSEATPEPQTPRPSEEDEGDDGQHLTVQTHGSMHHLTPVKGGSSTSVGPGGVVTPPKTPEEYLAQQQAQQAEACNYYSSFSRESSYEPYSRESSVDPQNYAYSFGPQ